MFDDSGKQAVQKGLEIGGAGIGGAMGGLAGTGLGGALAFFLAKKFGINPYDMRKLIKSGEMGGALSGGVPGALGGMYRGSPTRGV